MAVKVESARRERTRERLLDAAREVFAEQGIDGASVEAICERAEFSRGAFYSNFSSKDELFLALMQREFESLHREVAEWAAGAGLDRDLITDPGRLSDAIQQVLGFKDADSRWVALVAEFQLHAFRDPGTAAAYTALETRLVDELGQVIKEIADGAGIRLTVPPSEVAFLTAAVHSRTVVEGLLAGHGEQRIRQLLSDRLAAVLLGVAATA